MTAQPNLTVETVDIATLTPDPTNARKHDRRNLDSIAGSLRQFGQRKPIVVTAAGTVLAGNGTLAAARELGWSEIAVVRTPADWDDDRSKAYALADNRTAELAAWDEQILSAQLVALDHAGWNLAEIGFETLQPSTNPDEEQAPTQDDVFEDEPEPVTKPGDLWLLGDHRVLCGDSFSDEDRARLIGDDYVRLVATDPPYAIYGSSTGIASDIADDKMVRPFFESLGRIVARVLPEFGHAYFCTDWRSWAAMWEAIKRAGLSPKNMLVWDKGNGLGNNYANTHELIGFWAKLPKTGAMTANRKGGQRAVLRPNVLRYNRVTGEEREHNAAKPVGLMEELIGNSSDPGDVVLDLFGGSGSTLIAAHNLGRRALLMEMEPKFVDVIVRRWERKTGSKAEKI